MKLKVDAFVCFYHRCLLHHHAIIKIGHYPQRPGNEDDCDKDGEDQSQNVPTLPTWSVEMEKVMKVHQDLSDRSAINGGQDGPLWQRTAFNQQKKGDSSEKDSQNKAC